MKLSKKESKLELKRMYISFSQQSNSRKPKLNECLICKNDPGKNFVLKYKRNSELKGKICFSCYHKTKPHICNNKEQPP